MISAIVAIIEVIDLMIRFTRNKVIITCTKILGNYSIMLEYIALCINLKL